LEGEFVSAIKIGIHGRVPSPVTGIFRESMTLGFAGACLNLSLCSSKDASQRHFPSMYLVLIVFCAIKIVSEEGKALLTVFRAVIFRIRRQKGWNPGK